MAFRSRGIVPLAALALAACTTVNTTEASFEGSRWQVTRINGQATPATHMYRVQFENGQFGGRFGCNQFGGSYEVERERLIVREVASTLIGCPEPSATHESQAFVVLGQPMRIEWQSGDRLTLSNAAGSITLEPLPRP